MSEETRDNKINYAMVIVSQALQKLIVTTLKSHDVMYSIPLSGDCCILPYIKQNVSDFTAYDALLIDLGALRDTDGQIIEAIEAVRFFDDSIRIIIFAGTRADCFGLLNKCFLNGIYNLIPPGKYTEMRGLLEKAVLSGIAYKDALQFRDEEEYKKNAGMKLSEEDGIQKAICITGACRRVGVTHCALLAAHTLCKSGYLAAIVDCGGSDDYVKLANSLHLTMEPEGCFHVDEGIDIYSRRPLQPVLEDKAYHYVIYDMEPYSQANRTEDPASSLFGLASERLLLCGSKPWELEESEAAARLFGELQLSVTYLFTMTPPAMQADIVKRMKKAGAEEKAVHFLEYLPDCFSESDTIKRILQVKEAQGRKGRRFFSARRRR